MKRTLRIASVLIAGCIFGNINNAGAQNYEVPEGYIGYYDEAHKVIVREAVLCEENGQELWNGASVRIINGYVNIFKGENRILSGLRVWLEHNGYYSVQKIDSMYLFDPEGNATGVTGNSISVLWNGCCSVRKGKSHQLFDLKGNRIGDFESTATIMLFHNGFYCYEKGNSQRAATKEGKDLGISGDVIYLTDEGKFQCYLDGIPYYYDIEGNKID